jgi:hypothetical protein
MYHANLTRNVARILDCSVEEHSPGYVLEQFQKEFVARGFYGYMICSYFLGQMMMDRIDQIDYKIMCRSKIQDLAHSVLSQGGEHVSQKLAGIFGIPGVKGRHLNVFAFKFLCLLRVSKLKGGDFVRNE